MKPRGIDSPSPPDPLSPSISEGARGRNPSGQQGWTPERLFFTGGRERQRAARLLRHEYPLALALSGALVWLAQFHHFRDFGLYEDDYWFISEAMGKDA